MLEHSEWTAHSSDLDLDTNTGFEVLAADGIGVTNRPTLSSTRAHASVRPASEVRSPHSYSLDNLGASGIGKTTSSQWQADEL